VRLIRPLADLMIYLSLAENKSAYVDAIGFSDGERAICLSFYLYLFVYFLQVFN